MRLRLAALCLLVLAFPLGAAAGSRALVVTFKASGQHADRQQALAVVGDGVDRGAAAGTVTAQVIDPLKTVHAVEFGGVHNRFVTNIKFKGRFADFVIFPPISRGVGVTFRVTVKTALGRKVFNYPVTAK